MGLSFLGDSLNVLDSNKVAQPYYVNKNRLGATTAESIRGVLASQQRAKPQYVAPGLVYGNGESLISGALKSFAALAVGSILHPNPNISESPCLAAPQDTEP